MVFSCHYFLSILCASIFSVIYFQLGQREIYICMALCFLVLTLEYCQSLQNARINMTMFHAHQLNENRIHSMPREHTTLNNLLVFQALRYYTTYSIDGETSNETINLLIRETEKTKIFTLVVHSEFQMTTKSMHIEFVQGGHSYIVSISLTSAYSISFREKINALFYHIFLPKNVLQVWGNMNYELPDYLHYEYLSLNFINLQEKFKEWYNDTFPHPADCREARIDISTDGQACTCGHRPYKSFDAQWSLSRAIDYTFDACITLPLDGIHQCLAITKLAKIIRQKWTIEELELYMDMQYEHDTYV